MGHSRLLALLAGMAALGLTLIATPAAALQPVFAGTWGLGGSHQGRVYRYENGTTWTELSPPGGLGDAVWDLEWFDGALWASTHEGPCAHESRPSMPFASPGDLPHGDRGRVWRNDGSGWIDVSPPGGFGSAVTTLSVLDGQLYVTVDQDGLRRWAGLSPSGNDWQVVDNFSQAGQAIVSSVQDGRPRLFVGQDEIDELWMYDDLGATPCGVVGPTCQRPALGSACSAGCFGGSCIHAFAEFDPGTGTNVYAGAYFSRIYDWNRTLRTFQPIDPVPSPTNATVQGLAAYHSRLWVGLADGSAVSTADGRAATYRVERVFGADLPVSEMMTDAPDDLLWVGFGGVPYRWARGDGTSGVQTFDGTSWVGRALPLSFGMGVLSFLTVPPAITCDAGPAVQEVECEGVPIAVTLAGSTSPVPGILGLTVTASWSGDFVEGTATGLTPTVHFVGLGDHVATLTVTAGTASSTCSTTVRIVDTTPPAFSGRTQCLWPPDHRYRCFDVADLVAGGSARALDVCDGIVRIKIEGVSSSQAENANGVGDGSSSDDILFDAARVCVRQERQGVSGDGRDYTVVLVATDASGNTTRTQGFIHVPHDMRPDRRCDFHPVDPGLLPHAPLPLDPGRQEGTYPFGPPRRIHR